MKACVRYAPMIGAREGELPREDAQALAAHLDSCPACRALAADVAATEGLLAEALLARANARDFSPFVDQVMARVGAAGAPEVRPARAPGRAGLLGSLVAALRAHRVATASALGALLAVAAVAAFMYVQRDVDEPPEYLASVELSTEGGNTVLQTSDGPVVLLEPDDDSGS